MSEAVLLLVPARGGSRRIPGKNLRRIGGIPLVGWAVRNAVRAARRLEGSGHRVVCSTEDERIAEAARAWGADVPFRRPQALADDGASSIDVALHALDFFAGRGESFAAMALVQATSPLAIPDDIGAAIRLSLTHGGAPVVTVTGTHPASWHQRTAGGVLEPAFGEDAGEVVVPSGAAFVIAPDRLRATRRFLDPGQTRPSPMPRERAVDIDTEADLALAEALLAGRATSTLPIVDREVGGSSPCFVVAEAGVNHDGSRDKAHALVDAAADAGADAVKFQTWITEKLCRPGAPTAAYQREHDGGEDQFSMLKRLEMPYEWHAGLKEHAERRGLVFLSTPDEIDSARFLVDLGVPALKVGSGELTNLPFLRELAGLGRPLIVSTGMATIEEVGDALDAVDSGGSPSLALLHGVSAYPAPEDEMNVRCLTTLRQAFGCPVGLTDHTTGTTAAVMGVALGMNILEKHLTLDRSLPGPDHAASADPTQLRELIGLLRNAERTLGDGVKATAPSEEDTRRVVRRALTYVADLSAGHVLRVEDLIALRCGREGVPPGMGDRVAGQRLARSVQAGAVVLEDDLA